MSVVVGLPMTPSGSVAGVFVGSVAGAPGGAASGSALAGALLAAAALCWPSRPRPRPAARRRGGRPASPRASGRRGSAAVVGVVGVTAVVAAGALAGTAGILTATMLGATGLLLGRRLLAERRRRRALPDILRGLRTLNRELRAGADPLAAVDGAGRACRGAGALVLGRLVVLMRSRTDEEPTGEGAEPEDRVLDVLRSGWLLSRRHGVAFGRVVSRIADELSDEIAAEQARAAQLAGPRLSGYVMAGLPVMGLLLGAGMGVNPVGVLLGSVAGHLLLMVGVALMCAGLLWSARIVGR